MSDQETTKAKAAGWSDRQRFAYFFNLVDFSKVKLDYTNAPRPEAKSVGACQIMVHRLKSTLKDDIAALTGGTVTSTEDTPKKKPAAGRKRKAKDADGDDDATPTKRGRKKKDDVAEEVEVEQDACEEESQAKMEVNDDLNFDEDN